MSYTIIYKEPFATHIELHRRAGNKGLLRKIDVLLDELEQHPRTGTGKPEQLKHYEVETWSRRIDSKHRLTYEIHDNKLTIIALSAYGHYGDK